MIQFEDHSIAQFPIVSSRVDVNENFSVPVTAWQFCLWKISFVFFGQKQCGITCGAIDELNSSLKAMDKRIIINFDKKMS